MEDLIPAGAMENDKNCAIAPCGNRRRVRIPVGARQGEWLECPYCGKTHQLTKTNGDGRPPKLE